jgi:hypothetical protein
MSIENIILKSFLKKEIYSKYYQYIFNSYLKDNYPEHYKIYSILPSLFQQFDRTVFSVDDLQAFFFSNYPADVYKDTFVIIFTKLSQVNADNAVVQSLLEEYKKREVASKLAIAAIEVTEGKRTYEDFITYQSKVNREIDIPKPEDIFVTDDLYKLHAARQKQGLRWRLKSLNTMLGSIRKGHFGFVIARPEAGKTTFVADQGTFMAEQAEAPVAWFNNEQEGMEVMTRCHQAALGITQRDLFADLEGNKRKYEEKLKGRIKIVDDAYISRQKIERIVEELKPSLIIIDQIDKVKGFSDDRYDLEMKQIYAWGRELSKAYAPVIGLCQAGGTGENKKWLSMNDVDSSKTAKQGEADWILAIGRTDDNEKLRYFSLPKNKLPGDEDTDPEQRHGKAIVLLEADIARYRDINQQEIHYG